MAKELNTRLAACEIKQRYDVFSSTQLTHYPGPQDAREQQIERDRRQWLSIQQSRTPTEPLITMAGKRSRIPLSKFVWTDSRGNFTVVRTEFRFIQVYEDGSVGDKVWSNGTGLFRKAFESVATKEKRVLMREQWERSGQRRVR